MTEDISLTEHIFEQITTNFYFGVLFISSLVLLFCLIYFFTPVRKKVSKKIIIIIDLIWIVSSVATVVFYIQENNINTADSKIKANTEKLESEKLYLKSEVERSQNLYLEKIIKEKLPFIKTEDMDKNKSYLINSLFEDTIKNIKNEITNTAKTSCQLNPSYNQKSFEKLMIINTLIEKKGTITISDIQEVILGKKIDETSQVGIMASPSDDTKDFIELNSTLDKIYQHINQQKNLKEKNEEILTKKHQAENIYNFKNYFILIISLLLSIRIMKSIIEFDIERQREINSNITI